MKVALLSDIHANRFALESVYADLDREKVDHILIAGDLIGYYYWPREVVSTLMADQRVSCISGNHEKILAAVRNSGKAAATYRKKYGSGYDICLQALSQSEIDWIDNLPQHLSIDLSGYTFHLSHGTLSSTDEYLYPNAEFDNIADNYSECTFTVFGHTHYPFLHSQNGKFLINPGSVGQPRDIGGLASYVVVDLNNLVIRFKRARFDIEKVISAAQARDPNLEYLHSIMTRQ